MYLKDIVWVAHRVETRAGEPGPGQDNQERDPKSHRCTIPVKVPLLPEHKFLSAISPAASVRVDKDGVTRTTAPGPSLPDTLAAVRELLLAPGPLVPGSVAQVHTDG